MSFSVTVGGVENAFAGLDKRTIAKGTARGLTKMGRQARTAVKRRIRKVYTAKAAAVTKAISVTRAQPHHLSTIITATGRRISLIKYQARQTKRGVKVRVRRSDAPELLPGKFIATAQGSTQVFGRPPRGGAPRRKGNLPIRAEKGPAIPQVFGSKRGFLDLQRFVDRKLSSIIAHEIFFEVNKKRLRPGGRGV